MKKYIHQPVDCSDCDVRSLTASNKTEGEYNITIIHSEHCSSEKRTFSFRLPSRGILFYDAYIWRRGNEDRAVETISTTTMCSVAPASRESLLIKICFRRENCELFGVGIGDGPQLSEMKSSHRRFDFDTAMAPSRSYFIVRFIHGRLNMRTSCSKS
ncbi:hypothetical protein QTP88_015847 [Uroleucon formosanum]